MPREVVEQEEAGLARKRKRATDVGDTSSNKQQRIQDLFPVNNIRKATEFCSSHNKPASQVKSSKAAATVSKTHQTLSVEKMYSFPTSKAASSNVIDLTSSSPAASPRKTTKINRDPQQGARKITVKNFRTAPRTDPKVYVDGVIERLEVALETTLHYYDDNRKNGTVPQSMETLYKGVENACRMGYAEDIYQKLDARRLHTINQQVVPALARRVKEGASNVEVLRATLIAWSQSQAQMTTVQSIYFYMDRAFLLRNGRPSIMESGTTIFRDNVFEDPKFRGRILDGVCDLITMDRSGKGFDEELCHSAISMFHDLTVYTHAFEPRLLSVSQSFAEDWAGREVASSSLTDYVLATLSLMSKEMLRGERCQLEAGTRSRLLRLLEEHLISRRADYLVQDKAVGQLLDENSVNILEKLYSLLQRQQLQKKLKGAFVKWIDETGTAIVQDVDNQDDMVVNLLSLKIQLDNIWNTAFHRDSDLSQWLRETFEVFINRNKKSASTWNTDNNKPGEMIAKHVDLLLRGGSKAIPTSLKKGTPLQKKTDEEEEDLEGTEDQRVNIQLDQVLDLFRFVHGKAVFEAFYKKDLARRLLLNRSASADAERSMLTRLKTECGGQFTSNLEQMFKDIEIGREEEQGYRQLREKGVEDNSKASVDLSVHVLSAAAWPSYPDVPLQLPSNIQHELKRYETFYGSQHSGRKIVWKHALAHCTLRAKFPKGPKELVVSGFQAVMLLLFNGKPETEQVSYEYLKASSGLPDADLKRTLQSLACAMIRPLRKHPKGREIEPTDVFSWNAAFEHPKFRVKINQVQLKETKEENKATHERVQEDRNFETQAAIVRIMKEKKTIQHNNLIAEVIDATKKRGVLSVADIKKNIDRLIEKEYMERDENGSNAYAYIA